MPQPAITVDSLGKAYRIGLKEEVPDTLVGAATGWLKAPLRNLQNLRRLNTFTTNHDDQPDLIWALRDVSFEVPEGEVLGVIGRNGAGKSTLLKILSRITEPTRGRAVIHGRVSSLLEVGTGFHQELSGRENIYMNGTILGMRKREIDRKLDQIIDFSGVEKFLDTPIKRYSSGMKVRLAFAVAAHLEPEILIIDEVLAVGDAEFQRKCMGKMKDVAQGGRTVLFVSHNLSAISQLCQHGIVLEKGKLSFRGDISQALNFYSQSHSIDVSKKAHTQKSAHIADASICDDEGNEVGAVTRTANLNVVVTVQNTDEPFAAALGISVETSSFIRIVASNTFDRDSPLHCPTGSSTFRVTLPDLPLNQGRYFVTLAVHDLKTGTVRDRQDQFITFEVVEPAGAGKMTRRPNDGLVICEFNWEHLPPANNQIAVTQ